MKSQFDYQELIDELKDEIDEGSLTKSEVIQVLRSDQAEADGYRPIIDWHYNKKTMDIELAPDRADSKEDIQDKAILKKQYLEDLPHLQDITVEACLSEMFSKSTT